MAMRDITDKLTSLIFGRKYQYRYVPVDVLKNNNFMYTFDIRNEKIKFPGKLIYVDGDRDKEESRIILRNSEDKKYSDFKSTTFGILDLLAVHVTELTEIELLRDFRKRMRNPISAKQPYTPLMRPRVNPNDPDDVKNFFY